MHAGKTGPAARGGMMEGLWRSLGIGVLTGMRSMPGLAALRISDPTSSWTSVARGPRDLCAFGRSPFRWLRHAPRIHAAPRPPRAVLA
jgi:hypothetical protein